MAQVRTTARVIIRDHGWKQIKVNARWLDGRGVKAGILAKDAGTRGMVRDWKGNVLVGETGARVVDYAVWNEFGTNRIPSRPFMRRTFDVYPSRIVEASLHAAEAALLAASGFRERHLHALGRWYVERIQDTLHSTKHWAVPLARVTVERKHHDIPLLDFGILRKSIDYALAGRKKP